MFLQNLSSRLQSHLPNFFKLAAPHFDEQTEGGVRSTLLLSRILRFAALGLKPWGAFPTLPQGFTAASKIKTQGEGPTPMGARAELICYFARQRGENVQNEAQKSPEIHQNLRNPKF